MDWFPLWLSLRVAAVSTTVSVTLGVWVAYLLANRTFRFKELAGAMVTLPLVLPPTVLAYYLLVLLGHNTALGRVYEWAFGGPLVFTWQAAVVAAILNSAPLLIKSARAAFESADHSLERAARTLGASEWRLFWRVTFPLAWRTVSAAVVLAFARSMADFGVTLMIAGHVPGKTQTVAVAIYDAVEAGNGAVARALVLTISAVVLLILSIANRLHSDPAGTRNV